jgi:hypothetical protein
MASLEPWPGYLSASDSRRLELLTFKVDEARLRWDLLYAHTVCSAVANFEAREGGEGGAVHTAAVNFADEIAKAAASGFKEAGGWGHGEKAGGWGHG